MPPALAATNAAGYGIDPAEPPQVDFLMEFLANLRGRSDQPSSWPLVFLVYNSAKQVLRWVSHLSVGITGNQPSLPDQCFSIGQTLPLDCCRHNLHTGSDILLMRQMTQAA